MHGRKNDSCPTSSGLTRSVLHDIWPSPTAVPPGVLQTQKPTMYVCAADIMRGMISDNARIPRRTGRHTGMPLTTA